MVPACTSTFGTMTITSFVRVIPLLPPSQQAAGAGAVAALAAASHAPGRVGDSPRCTVEQLHETVDAIDTLVGMIGLMILALVCGMRLFF